MSFATCRACGMIFHFSGYGEELCPACKHKDEVNFENVKKYLENNPGAQIQEVSEFTQVPVKVIAKWLKTERLIVHGMSSSNLKCETCGAQIPTGKLCAACKRRLAQGFAQAGMSIGQKKENIKEEAAKNKGMHFIGIN